MKNSTLGAPIFIGGLIKSGTSLVRAMLGQHSKIASGLETYWFDMNWPNDERMGNHQPGLPGRYEHDLDRQIERLGVFFKMPKEAVNEIKENSNNPEDFLNQFMNHYTHNVGKARWLEKTPGNILHIPRILSTWPNAKILVCVRNPLDVYASCKESGLKDDPTDFGELWNYYYSSYATSLSSGLLNDDNHMVVSYEQLITSTQQMMGSIMEFLGESFEPSVAEYKGQSEEFDIVKEVTGKESTTLNRMKKGITNSRIDIYKNIVSKDEIEVMKSLAHQAGLSDMWRSFSNQIKTM